MTLNRRGWLARAGGAAAIAALPACKAKNSHRNPLSGASLMDDVDTYVAFGDHRSGGPADVATSDWLAAHWRRLGYDFQHQSFETPNVDTTLAAFVINNVTFVGFAQAPVKHTLEGGLRARVSVLDSSDPDSVRGNISLVYIARERGAPSPSQSYRDAFLASERAGAVGVLAVTSSPSGEVVAINTPMDARISIPVLCIPERDKKRLETALAATNNGVLHINGPGGMRTARNTIARRGESGPWVVISTPQSGWFTCGGERGPGIAISRALSEWAASSPIGCRWLFIATSGHEWIDVGARLFHASLAPKPQETAFWLHLGASFAARDYQEILDGLQPLDGPNRARWFMVSADMISTAKDAFAGHPVIDAPMLADEEAARGEIRHVIASGYESSAGFWGGHGLFHTPIDGADATTAEIMEPIAQALVQMLETKLSSLSAIPVR